MPRGKLLTEDEKTKINCYKEMGCSNRATAKKLGRSHHLINNFISLGNSYGKYRPKGTNQKLTRRQLASISRLASSGNVTAQQIKCDLNLPVTKRRVQQILSDSKRFKWRKKVSKSPLKETHKQARLKFAQNHMTWDHEWRNVIFSDEKKFNLDGPDGLKYYWHDLRKNTEVAMSRNFGGGSVMVWAAFTYNNKTPICFISTRMNSDSYIELLETVLIDFGEQMPSQDWIFQQDNAAIHSSKRTKEWFQ